MRAAFVWSLCSFAAGLPAQDLRYEVGLRVRAFERAFEEVLADVATRQRIRPNLERAVTSFFGMSLGEAGRQMDLAQRRLKGAGEPDDAVQWADSITLDPEARLIDASAKDLRLKLRCLYRVDAEVPAGARLRVSFAGSTREVGGEKIPPELRLDLADVPEGDHTLRFEVRLGERILSRREQTVSCVAKLAPRLEKLLPLVEADVKDTRTATMRGLARTLRALQRGRTMETDMPALELLVELERLFADGQPGGERTEDVRLWLWAGEHSVPTRVLVPARVREADAKVPLVLALHGAGGTENLFFDGYGAGKIVRLCRERGWLLVAPRSTMFGRGGSVAAMIKELAAIYPLDATRVLGVGHSMGAGQLMREVSADPSRFRAVAALGGGGSVRGSDALRRLPVLVAAGDRDFGLPGARRLHRDLKTAGVETLRLAVYEATEHLGIVQVALGDVFAFFDRALR